MVDTELEGKVVEYILHTKKDNDLEEVTLKTIERFDNISKKTLGNIIKIVYELDDKFGPNNYAKLEGDC